MKSCHFCGHENKDTAKFCVKCGKSLEKHCPKCDAEVGEEEIYCPQCGTRLDGKVNCPKCNAENDGTAAFCELCGAPLKALPVEKGRAPNPYSVRSQGVYARSNAPAPVEKEPPKAAPKKRRICKSLLSRALDITRASLIMAFALVMFIMSFMSVAKINTEDMDLGDMDMGTGVTMELIEANVSTIDFIEGAFYRIDPMTEEALVKDFALYFKDHLSKQGLKVFDRLTAGDASVSDAMRAIEIFERIIEDYNVLKLISSKTVAENTPSATMELWFCAALSLLYIGLSFAFFITSLVDFINTLKGKKSKANLSVCAFALASALGAAVFGYIALGGSLGFGIITFLVFALLCFTVETGYRIFSGELRFSKQKLPRYISAAVGTVLAVLVLCFMGSSLLSVTCSYEEAAKFHAGYNVSMLASAWNSLKLAELNPELIGSAESYFNSVFSGAGTSAVYGDKVIFQLSPSLMGIIGQVEIENLLAALGILIYLLVGAVVVTLVLSVTDRIKALTSDREAKLVYGILEIVFIVVLLGLVIAYSALVTNTLEGFPKFQCTAGVSGLLVASVVLVAAEFIQRLVFRFLEKKKSSPSESEEISEEKESREF